MKNKFLIPIFLFSLAGTALAYNLLQPLPVVGQTVESFPDYITKIIPFILGLAAVLAVVEIVIGGIEYAVTEAIDAKADAKDRIRQAILGLLLALASWLILYTINPELINLKLNIPGLPSAQQGGDSHANQFPCPAGQNNTFCDAGQECIFEAPPINQYVCKTGTGTTQPSPSVVPPPSSAGPACPPGQNSTSCNVGFQCILNLNNNPTYICANPLGSGPNSIPKSYCLVSTDFCKPYGGCAVANLSSRGGSCPTGRTCYTVYEGQPK